jgi:serine/threonine protein phosphatase PrpC
MVIKRDIIQDSDQRQFQVRKGDLIILSSDGLYDVVEDHSIERICRNREENV